MISLIDDAHKVRKSNHVLHNGQPTVVNSYQSYYPLALSEDTVKSTLGHYTTGIPGHFIIYYEHQAVDPTFPLTGDASYLSPMGQYENNRFHIDLGTAKVIKHVYYENFHYSGLYTQDGYKNFTFWGSNSASAFADLNYEHDTNWTELDCNINILDQHADADQADPKYISVDNTKAYRYYAFKFANTFGTPPYNSGIRRIELQEAIHSIVPSGSLPTVPFRCAVTLSPIEDHEVCTGTVNIGSEVLIFTEDTRKTTTTLLTAFPTILTSGLECNVLIEAINAAGAPLLQETSTAIKIRMRSKTKSVPSPQGGWVSIRESYAISKAIDDVDAGDIIRYGGVDYTVAAIEPLRGFASSELFRKLMF